MSEPGKHGLLRPNSIRVVWKAFLFVLALTVIAGFFIHHHAHFGIEATYAFNAWYGFVTCVGIVLLANFLGVWLKRKDSYYD